MNIVAFELEEWEKKSFEIFEDQHHVKYIEHPLSKRNADLFHEAEIISCFIYSDLKREVLEKLPQLKLICVRGTGVDHVDLEYCQEKNIQVANVPDYGQNTVAEHVFGLLLTLSHHLYPAIDRTKKGDFTQQGLQGFDLNGRTIGVIGTGSIGKHVIQIAKGFGLKVFAYDIEPDHDFANFEGFHYVDFDTLLEDSDIITLHVPSNPITYHLLDQEAFKKMKQDVVIINTARGDVIDVKAMIQALAEGKVAGAGLDVLPDEPVVREEAELLRSVFQKEYHLEELLADHILLRLKNVIITPHSAFNTKEAVQRILDTTVENIQGFISGSTKNVVHL